MLYRVFFVNDDAPTNSDWVKLRPWTVRQRRRRMWVVGMQFNERLCTYRRKTLYILYSLLSAWIDSLDCSVPQSHTPTCTQADRQSVRVSRNPCAVCPFASRVSPVIRTVYVCVQTVNLRTLRRCRWGMRGPLEKGTQKLWIDTDDDDMVVLHEEFRTFGEASG